MLDRRRVTDFRFLRFRVDFRFSLRINFSFRAAPSRILVHFRFRAALPLVAGGQRNEIGGFDGRGAEELDRTRLFHANQNLDRRRQREEEKNEKRDKEQRQKREREKEKRKERDKDADLPVGLGRCGGGRSGAAAGSCRGAEPAAPRRSM